MAWPLTSTRPWRSRCGTTGSSQSSLHPQGVSAGPEYVPKVPRGTLPSYKGTRKKARKRRPAYVTHDTWSSNRPVRGAGRLVSEAVRLQKAVEIHARIGPIAPTGSTLQQLPSSVTLWVRTVLLDTSYLVPTLGTSVTSLNPND